MSSSIDLANSRFNKLIVSVGQWVLSSLSLAVITWSIQRTFAVQETNPYQPPDGSFWERPDYSEHVPSNATSLERFLITQFAGQKFECELRDSHSEEYRSLLCVQPRLFWGNFSVIRVYITICRNTDSRNWEEIIRIHKSHLAHANSFHPAPRFFRLRVPITYSLFVLKSETDAATKRLIERKKLPKQLGNLNLLASLNSTNGQICHLKKYGFFACVPLLNADRLIAKICEGIEQVEQTSG